LEKYQEVQRIAKRTMKYLRSYIREGVTEQDIAHASDDFMRASGVSSFWYHGVGTLVLVGERTALSVSGRDYASSSEAVKPNDLVTVDLSPDIDSYWGDLARSFVIVRGEAEVPDGKTHGLFSGIRAEKFLHKMLMSLACPSMTFEELHTAMNAAIGGMGYSNLDFRGNLGHSIEKDMGDRVYIEKGNRSKLSDAGLFTFEPHIQAKGSPFGYKMENIYYFDAGKLRML